MKANKLFETINDIDEKIVEEAEIKHFKSKGNIRYLWKVLLPVAVCIAIVIIAVPRTIQNDVMPDTSNPEKISIDTEGFFSNEMGFEGYQAYSIDDIKNSNPWNEKTNIKTLPVFKNAFNYDNDGHTVKPDIEAMTEKARGIAILMGIDEKDIKITDDYPTQKQIDQVTEKYESTGESVPPEFFRANRVFVKTENIEIEVDAQMVVTIQFEPAVSLPDKYNFDDLAPYNDIYRLGEEYLKSEYRDLLRMKKPKINVYGGDYSYTGEQRFYLNFYEGNGSIEEQILNYNFNCIDFHSNEEGKLWLIRINQTDLSEKIGDYPVITPQQAEELLIQKKYITTVPEEFSGKEYIKKVELVYRNGREETLIPYYKFYVEMPSLKREDEFRLNTYGAFYVPAIEEKYIENMPLWDGSFN